MYESESIKKQIKIIGQERTNILQKPFVGDPKIKVKVIIVGRLRNKMPNTHLYWRYKNKNESPIRR